MRPMTNQQIKQIFKNQKLWVNPKIMESIQKETIKLYETIAINAKKRMIETAGRKEGYHVMKQFALEYGVEQYKREQVSNDVKQYLGILINRLNEEVKKFDTRTN